VPANPAKLVHPAETADNGMVLNDYVAGEGAIVGKNHVISDRAVMRDVRIGKEVIVTSNQRLRIRHGAAIHGTELSKAVVIPDLEKRRLAPIL
jgi:UDP-3-O-[3-hydroxymyristoyl] glucosamine N-acyltransferase